MTLQDEANLRGLAESAQSAWNRSDSVAIASLFAEDAEFVDVLGQYHRGRPLIEAGHRQIFDTIYKGSRIQYKIVSVRPIRPDVAVVFLHARLHSHLPANEIDAADRENHIAREMFESTARPTLIAARNAGRWEVVAFQNTKEAVAT